MLALSRLQIADCRYKDIYRCDFYKICAKKNHTQLKKSRLACRCRDFLIIACSSFFKFILVFHFHGLIICCLDNLGLNLNLS